MRAAGGLMPGMQGAKPLAQNNLGLPLPAGKGGRGDGGNKPMMRQVHPATRRASRPPGTGTAGAVRAAGGLMAGMQGAKPLAQNNLGLPLPAGKSALRARVGGIGAINL